MAVSFLLKVLDFYYFFLMPYTTGSIEVNVLTCEADHLMDCGFMFL